MAAPKICAVARNKAQVLRCDVHNAASMELPRPPRCAAVRQRFAQRECTKNSAESMTGARLNGLVGNSDRR